MGVKVISQYKKYPESIKAGFWFTICNFLQKGISMLSIPFFTRLLTVEEYGVYSVYQSTYMIIIIIATLNLSGSVINNGMVKYEKKKSEFISALIGLSTTTTIISFFIYLIFQEKINCSIGLPTILIVTMFIQFLFEPAYLFWLQKNKFEYNYKKTTLITIIVSVLSVLVSLIAVLVSNNKVFARIIYFALIHIAFGLIFYIMQMYKGKVFYKREYWKFALIFNIPLIPHYLSQIVLGQSDRIMISAILGDREAAIYSLAYTVSTIMTLLITAINSSFIPTIYKSMKEKEYKVIKKTSNTLYILMASAVIIIMLVGPEIILILGTAEYYEAVKLIPPIAASVFFVFLYSIFINIEFYFEDTKKTMYISILGATLNVLLNYILIPVFGYGVAAYTTLICYILFSVGHYILQAVLTRKNGVVESIFDTKMIILISILLILSIVAANIIYEFLYLRYSIVLILGITAIKYKDKIIKLIL